MQTQTSNTLHNAIMEAGSKDRPPMLASGNYIQRKSRIKRYIDTKPNRELIHYCLVTPPYELGWKEKPFLDAEGNPTNSTDKNSSTRTHQAATRNRGKAVVNSSQPIYDQEPSMIDDDEDTSKDKEIDKLMALISLSFKKIYKPIKNNLRTSSNTSRVNQDNSPRIHINAGYEGQRSGTVAGARETVGSSMDDTVDESDDQELEAHYMYMAKIQEVSSDAVDSRPIFDTEPEHKNDEDVDLAKERELLASLIAKLKCEIDESKNRNTLLETSNKVLVEKLKSKIADFKNKNKRLTEANNKLSEENDLQFADFMKSKAELKRRDSIEYATKMELECAKVKGDLLSYKMKYESLNFY
nr:hypothetical protein [Tanacetum cinerariifolium]